MPWTKVLRGKQALDKRASVSLGVQKENEDEEEDRVYFVVVFINVLFSLGVAGPWTSYRFIAPELSRSRAEPE